MRISKPTWLLLQIPALVLLVAGFLIFNQRVARADDNPIPAGLGIPGNAYQIANCTQLQAMQGSDGTFELAGDIDCSGTSTWNSGQGFTPIDNFTGSFDGKGHTIDGLFMHPVTSDGVVGMFKQTTIDTSLLNFKLTNALIYGDPSTSNPNAATGGVVGRAVGSNLSLVSFDGQIILEGCQGSQAIGGIAGYMSTETLNSQHYQNVLQGLMSSSGSINVNGTDCGEYNYAAGGLIGRVLSNNPSNYLNIYRSYSTMDITLSGSATADCSAHCRSIGGIFGDNLAPDNFTYTYYGQGYATGTLTVDDTQNQYLSYNVGGLGGSSSGFMSSVNGTFIVMTPINVPDACDDITCGNNTRSIGAGIGTTSYGQFPYLIYDQTVVTTDSCANNTQAPNICTAYNLDGSDVGHYYNTVIDDWIDFSSTWTTTSGMPIISDNASGLTYPNKPQGISANILSQTSIRLSGDYYWNYNDMYTLDGVTQSFSKLYAMCKKSIEVSWHVCGVDDTTYGQAIIIQGLEPGTNYDFYEVTRNTSGYLSPASDVITKKTASPGFSLVTNCQELQNVKDNIANNYELGNDIDCSDTVNWNNGLGFEPIGGDIFSNQTGAFSGAFMGNNYTISDLYINNPLVGGLFSLTLGATIQDFTLANPVINATYLASSGVIFALNTPITNVHINNGAVSSELYVGGLSVYLLSDTGSITASKNSFTGSVTSHYDQTDGNDIAWIGGLVGAVDGVNVSNSYAQATLNGGDGPAAIGGLVGLIMSQNSSTAITNSYSTGLINTANNNSTIGGLIGGVLIYNDTATDINDNFSDTQVIVPNDNQTPPAGLLNLINLDHQEGLTLHNNYYNKDAANNAYCGLNVTSGCTGITGQPNYFKNNSANPPLNSWDFTNIWNVTPTYPEFGRAVTTGITSVDKPAVSGAGCITSIFSTKTCPTAPTPSAQGGGGSAETVATTAAKGMGRGLGNPADEVGVLGAIKHFVRSLPTVVVVAFPYALFGLLLVAIFLLLLELIRELRRAHVLEALINKQRLLAEERDAFWHLAANYLRAPVTLIVGGAEALSERHKNKDTEAISALAASLQTKVGEIMKKIEGSVSLQAIKKVPHGIRAGKVSRVAYFIPLLSLAALVIFANYAASWKSINPGTVGYTIQFLIFVIIAVVFYWTLSFLTGSKKRRLQAESIYQKQTAELNNARHELINDTATLLAGDTNRLDMAVKNLPVNMTDSVPGALQTLREGTDRLREIIRSFSLLIAVQESTAITKQTVDLGAMFGSIRAKLAPQITKKNVRVMAPSAALPVSAESEMAKQVIESIVANAVDYSPDGGTVKVETQHLGGKVRVRISDQGQGINKDQLAHLFQPFVRTDGKSAMDMSHGGFGINLYLDKLIMEKLGGNIEVDSTPGKGTAFTLTWPTSLI